MSGRPARWIALLPVACYLALALPLLFSPGLHIDEAADGLAALAIGGPPGEWPCVASRLMIGGRIYPLTEGPYHGGFTPYLLWPALKLLGSGTLTIRLTSAAIAALILWLLFRSCEAWFGTTAALLAALLTATDPVWAQYSRVLFHREEILLQLPWWAFWWAALSYARERSAWRLGLAGLALGLGLSMKITFLWYLTGLGVLLAVPSLRQAALPARPNGRAWALTLLGGLAGLSFIIVFNIIKPAVTIHHLWNALFDPIHVRGLDTAPAFPVLPEDTVTNLAYGHNLWLRLTQIPGLLGGRLPWPCSDDWGLSAPVPFLAWGRCVFFLSVLAGAFAFSLLRRDRPGSRAFLALALVYLTVVLWTPFTLSNFDPGHLMALFPFPQIAAAALFAGFRPGRARTLTAAALIALLTLNIGQNLAMAREISSDGGRGRWSRSIGELAQELDAQGVRQPVTFGIGLSETVAYLTGRRVIPLVLPELKAGRLDAGSYADAVQDGRLVYVWMGTQFESLELKNRFEEQLKRRGARVKLERVIRDHLGRPAYWIYSARLDGPGRRK